MDVLTDNKNRTVAEIRHLLSKYNGALGESGSVAWMFSKKGVILIPAKNTTEDDLMMTTLDAGADDIAAEEEYFRVTTEVGKLEAVKKALDAAKIAYESAEITMEPANQVKVEGKAAESVIKLMDALEEHEDIQNVYANFDIDEKTLEEMED